jgi:oligopeptide/dipeptide ABC transporter ATP-binding protein
MSDATATPAPVAKAETKGPLLQVEDLRVRFLTEDGMLTAVDGVSFELGTGEVLAIVGESGCGKSVTSQTMMGLTRSPNARIEGSVRYKGEEILDAPDEVLRRIRGEELAMIFQDPISALNPVYKVGKQIVEAIQAHENIDKDDALRRATELLGQVGIPDPARRVDEYPHEFSGGMRQRAMIAMGLALEPNVLIADEPTTALDVTIQAQILRLLKQLNEERGLAVIMVTHDLGVVADIADRVLVMYAGRVVESGTLDQIFYDPQHPYTWGLLGSLTRLDRPRTHRLAQIKGQPPSLIHPPEGCHFRSRCPHAFERCGEIPELKVRGGGAGHEDRCFIDPEKKKTMRVVQGDIGLEAPAA